MEIKKNFDIFSMLGFPHLLTVLNLMCGLGCIIFSMNGQFYFACFFLIIAVVFDFFDGKAARYLERVSDFGRELDSLSDIVSFGVAPVVLSFNAADNVLGGQFFAVASYLLFVSAGALRLARFNIKKKEYFEGMPITLNGIIVPFVYFLGIHNWLPYIFIVSAFLMISSFRIKKIRG